MGDELLLVGVVGDSPAEAGKNRLGEGEDIGLNNGNSVRKKRLLWLDFIFFDQFVYFLLLFQFSVDLVVTRAKRVSVVDATMKCFFFRIFPSCC